MSRFSKISIAFFGISLLLFFISFNSEIAYFLNSTVCDFFRKALNKITSIIPFSLFEFAIIFSPVLCFLCIRHTLKWGLVDIISLFLCFASLYFLSLGIAYNSKTDLTDGTPVCEEEMICAAYNLAEKVSFYNAERENFSLLKKEIPGVKNVVFSGVLTRLRILGLYSYPSSEININRFLPDYIYCFTVFHELSHLDGYARDGEANLNAFIVLTGSENDFFKYSASLYALEFLLSDIYKFSTEEYFKILNTIPKEAREDMREYSALLAKYPEIKLSGKINSGVHQILDKSSYSDFSRLVTLRLNTP